MKSKITIDVDLDNQPVIKIDYTHSDDIRDKLIKRFLEKFGSESCYATFRFDHYKSDGTQSCLITPIEPKDLEEHSKLLKLVSDEYNKNPSILVEPNCIKISNIDLTNKEKS